MRMRTGRESPLCSGGLIRQTMQKDLWDMIKSQVSRLLHPARVISLSIIFLILGCGGSDLNSGNEIVQPDFDFIKTDSLGIELGDSNYVFGTIIDAAFMPDGRIVLLDVLLNRISVFSRNGEYLFSFGSEGNGPGEFIEPASIAILSNGDIAVPDFMQNKLIFFDSSGVFKREITNFFPQTVTSVESGRDSSIIGMQMHYYNDDENFYVGSRLAAWSGSPEPQIIYYTEYNRFDGEGPVYIPAVSFCTDPDGNIFFAPFSQDEYAIIGLTSDGDTLLHISEPHTRMLKTPEEIASEHMSYRLDTPGFDDSDRRAISARWEPDPVRYAITGLYLDQSLRLWAATGRGEGPSPVFEVYDIGGTHLYTVSTSLPPEARKWKMVFGDNRILAFDTNPDDYSRVIILEIIDRNAEIR